MKAAETLYQDLEFGGRITDREAARRYVQSGKATFTLVGRSRRFTFEVNAGRGPAKHLFFVRVLTGPDNEFDYAFIGTLFPGLLYIHSPQARLSIETPSNKAATWFFDHALDSDEAFDKVQMWHHGHCGRCGRLLTVPDSVAAGLGPTCVEKVDRAP